MPRPDAAGLAAECLPGQGEVRLEEIGQGLFNDTYRAHRAGRQFVLRIARERCAESPGAREFEARLVARAATAGLAPPPVYADAARGILALEWLPGQPWEAATITTPERIGQAARLIRRVHGLVAPSPVHTRTPAGWVHYYRGALRQRHDPPDSLHAEADRALQALALMPPAGAVVCHSDLHRLNVLVPDAGGLAASVLLDWEYAHVSEPYWDLAGWSANNDFSAAQSRALLAAYGNADADAAEWRRFGLLRWLFDYVCVLWIRLYQHVLAQDAGLLGARAGLLETRLRAAVCGKLATYDEPFFLES